MHRPHLADVQSVFITVTGVDVQQTNGSAMTFSLASPLTVDLLTLQQGNVAALVNAAKVPADSYDWIRLDLDTSAGKNYVLVCPAGTGTTCASPTNIALTIPSGAETGLKIVRGFTMPVNGAIHLMIDFAVDSSIVPIPNSTSWHMKPVLRVVQTDTVGSIAGTISASAMQAAKFSKAACSSTNLPTVYVYAAQSATTNVTPDDIFTGTEETTETPVQPIVTQLTTYNTADMAAHFNIQWLASDSGYNERDRAAGDGADDYLQHVPDTGRCDDGRDDHGHFLDRARTACQATGAGRRPAGRLSQRRLRPPITCTRTPAH